MPTAATAGYGTVIKIGDGGGPETFTTIAEVISIQGPNLRLETVDVTNQDSTGGYREKIATLLDAGEVSMDLNFLPVNTTQSFTSGLIKDLKNKTKRNFRIVMSNAGATQWDFAAFVTGFTPGASVDGRLSASCTLQITGQPTLAG